MSEPYANALKLDWDVLRAAAGQDVDGLSWGAAMSVAIEYWQGHGCLRGDGTITPKGREALEAHQSAP